MDFSWIDNRTAKIPDHPNVTLKFAAPESENEEIIETVLGMLLQSFSQVSAQREGERNGSSICLIPRINGGPGGS